MIIPTFLFFPFALTSRKLFLKKLTYSTLMQPLQNPQSMNALQEQLLLELLIQLPNHVQYDEIYLLNSQSAANFHLFQRYFHKKEVKHKLMLYYLMLFLQNLTHLIFCDRSLYKLKQSRLIGAWTKSLPLLLTRLYESLIRELSLLSVLKLSNYREFPFLNEYDHARFLVDSLLVNWLNTVH